MGAKGYARKTMRGGDLGAQRGDFLGRNAAFWGRNAARHVATKTRHDAIRHHVATKNRALCGKFPTFAVLPRTSPRRRADIYSYVNHA